MKCFYKKKKRPLLSEGAVGEEVQINNKIIFDERSVVFAKPNL